MWTVCGGGGGGGPACPSSGTANICSGTVAAFPEALGPRCFGDEERERSFFTGFGWSTDVAADVAAAANRLKLLLALARDAHEWERYQFALCDIRSGTSERYCAKFNRHIAKRRRLRKGKGHCQGTSGIQDRFRGERRRPRRTQSSTGFRLPGESNPW